MIASSLEEPYYLVNFVHMDQEHGTFLLLKKHSLETHVYIYIYVCVYTYICFFHKSMHVFGSPILAVPGPSHVAFEHRSIEPTRFPSLNKQLITLPGNNQRHTTAASDFFLE